MLSAIHENRAAVHPDADAFLESGPDRSIRPEIFGIPFQGQVIIYAPLKRMAFLGNEALAGLIKDLAEENHGPAQDSDSTKQAIDFINKTNILAPDPVLPDDEETRVYRPICTTLFLTNQCNLRCIYCYADAGKEKPLDMPLDLALQAVDLVYGNALERGLDSFEVGFHGGGEPTLNWKVLEAVVEAAGKKSLRPAVTMSSNGCYTGEKLAFILDHFTGLSLSFDGPPEIQNQQRPQKDGSASFKQVMQTIAAFDRRNFNYSIRMTATPATLAQMPQAVEFLCSHTGVKQVQVEPAFARGRGKAVAVRAKEGNAFIRYFKQAYEIASAQGVHFFYSGARLEGLTRRFCTAPHEALVLLPSGEVSACFEVHNLKHPLASSLIIGKLNAGGLDLRTERWQCIMARQADAIPFCHDCFCKYHCAGDCLGKTFDAQDRAGFRPSVRCRINRELLKYLLAKKIAAQAGLWLGAVNP